MDLKEDIHRFREEYTDEQIDEAIHLLRTSAHNNVMSSATIERTDIERLSGFTEERHAVTKTGKHQIQDSHLNPAYSLEEVAARQRAIRELEAEPGTRKDVEGFLQEYARMERALGRLDDILGPFSHTTVWEAADTTRKRKKVVKDLSDTAQEFVRNTKGRLESDYLRERIEGLHSFKGSSFDRVARSWRIYTSWRQGNRHAEVYFLPPSEVPFKYRGVGLSSSPVDLVESLLAVATGGVAYLSLPNFPQTAFIMLGSMGLTGFSIMGLIPRAWLARDFMDYQHSNSDFKQLDKTVGQLDEVMAYLKYGESLEVKCLPALKDEPRHRLKIVEGYNPILLAEGGCVTPIDIEIGNGRMTFITAPNSAGKTRSCQTVTQIAVQGQCGSYVPARECDLVIADHIFYQAPNFAAEGKHGRCGTEGAETRNIFWQATPRTLAVLDELVEGTTHKDKIRVSKDILWGFQVKGTDVVVITHNYELAEEFKGPKQLLQVEYLDGIGSTRKLIEGVCKDSRVDEVLADICFTKGHILATLVKQGYLKLGSIPSS